MPDTERQHGCTTAAELPADEVRDIQSLNQQLAATAGEVWQRIKATRAVSIRIEMNRGAGWETRQHGEIDQDRAEVVAMIEATIDAYCAQYPHRALVDGEIVAEAQP